MLPGMMTGPSWLWSVHSSVWPHVGHCRSLSMSRILVLDRTAYAALLCTRMLDEDFAAGSSAQRVNLKPNGLRNPRSERSRLRQQDFYFGPCVAVVDHKPERGQSPLLRVMLLHADRI